MFVSDVPVEGKYDIVIRKIEECLKEDFDNVSYNTVSNEYEFTKDDTGYTVGCCPVEQETEDYEVYIDGNFDNPICFDTEKDCVSYIVDYIKNKILNTDVSSMDDDDMIYVVYDIVEDEDRLTAKCMNESTNDFQDIKLGKINTDSVNKLLNNLLNNPNYKITKETKDKIYKNSAPWGLAVQMTPSVDVDGTNGLLSTGDFGGEVSFGESIETNFEKGDRVTDGDREGTVLNSDSEKVMVEWDYSDTDDIEWVDKSTLELVKELNSRFLPNMEYCPACGGTRFNTKTGVCIDCGYDEGGWGNIQESLEENDEDGWGDRVEQILEPTIRKVEDLAYEVRNTVRGANTGCDTTDELADYVDEVIEDLEDANSSLRHEAEEIDESYEDGWAEEDINLHKSIDWESRNYMDFPVTKDSFVGEAILYGEGKDKLKNVKMIKYLVANPVYPPYYAPKENPFKEYSNVVGPMYDGRKHGSYQIHNRYETQELYDTIFESAVNNGKSFDSNNVFEIGDMFEFTGLYGGSYDCKIVRRNKDTVTVNQTWISEDTGKEISKTTKYNVHTDDEGEYIVMWQYRDEEGKVYAHNTVSLTDSFHTESKLMSDDCKLVEALAPYKKEEFKKQLQDELYDKMIKLFYTPEWGYENIKEIDEFINPVIEIEDYKGEYDNDIKVEFRAELNYPELEEICNVLDKVIQKYDKQSYFEPAETGIAQAYLKFPTNLKEDFEDTNTFLRHEAQEIDESKSINEDALDDQGISKTRVDIIAKQAPNSKFYIDKNRYVLGKDLLDYFNTNEILTYSSYETSDGIRVLNSYKIINRVVDESKSIKEDLKKEFKKQLQDELYDKFIDLARTPDWGFENLAEIDDYLMPTIEVNDYKGEYDNDIEVEFRAEVNYRELEDVCNTLDKVVKKYDKNAYFEPVQPGIAVAYLKFPKKLKENFEDDEIVTGEQEFDSAATSINSNKLPAVYNMVDFTPGEVVIDFGGGKFDNAVNYLKDKDVTLLVYDPYNRSAEHNKEVLRVIRENGGADAAINSNVLNVIKEPEARQQVLRNIKKLVKPGAPIYITVYEGSGKGNEGPTKSGYQLNRKTADYMDEIGQVFSNVKRKGKLITAINESLKESIAVDFSELKDEVEYNFDGYKKLPDNAFVLYRYFFNQYALGVTGENRYMDIFYGFNTRKEAVDFRNKHSSFFKNYSKKGKESPYGNVGAETVASKVCRKSEVPRMYGSTPSAYKIIKQQVTEGYQPNRKRLKDKIISTLEFLDTFEDIYKFPEDILGDSWDDLKSGILMGIDTGYEEIAQILVDYLEPSVEFDKRHPELLDEDPVAADALEEYENLKSELKESYGGTFDIEDNQYFTKEEIVGVAEKVCEHLDETYPDKFDVSDVYMETPTIIHVEVISKEGNWASANAKIDMRKIKKPSDIMKYDVVIGTLVYNLRLELDDLYGDEYMRESLSNDKLSRELQTYLQRLFGDYVEVESVEYFESPFGEESYRAEINVSELVDNYIDKRFTPLTYKLKEDGYLYVNKYSDIIVDVNGYESGVTLDCYNTVPYDVDMEQLDKEADIIGDKIIDVIQSHEEDIYDILRQNYYEEIEDDEELAESLLDIEIDMWYDDNPKDVTSLDVRFSDLDSTYSGNLYINNKIVGDYTTKDSVTLEKAFPQFDWKAYWDAE